LDYYSPEIIVLSLSVYGLLLFPIDLALWRTENERTGQTCGARLWLYYVALHLLISLSGILLLFFSGSLFFHTPLPSPMGLFLIAIAGLQLLFFSFAVFINQLSKKLTNILVWAFSFFVFNVIFGFGTLAFAKIAIFQLVLRHFALDLSEWLPMTFAIRSVRYFYSSNNAGHLGSSVLKAALYTFGFASASWLIAWARRKRRTPSHRPES